MLLSLLSCSVDVDTDSEANLNLNSKSAASVKSFDVYDCREDRVFRSYQFDNHGFLKKIDLFYRKLEYHFSYNSLNQVSNLTTIDASGSIIDASDLVYDPDGHLLKLGDRTFEYYEDEARYLEAEFLEYDIEVTDEFSWVENRYWEYQMTAGSPIPKFCERVEYVVTYTATGKVKVSNYCQDYSSCYYDMKDGNLITSGCGSVINQTYYDIANPLFNKATNLEYVMGFIAVDDLTLAHVLSPVVSKNLLEWTRYTPADPESSQMEYRLNIDGLPESSRVNWYYVGNYEGSCNNTIYTYY